MTKGEKQDVGERKQTYSKNTAAHVLNIQDAFFSFWPNDPLHTDWLRLLPSSPLLRANQLSPGLSARSEVEPDTGAHGATGPGHLDWRSREQMFAAAL